MLRKFKITIFYACRYEHENIINIDNGNGIPFDGNVLNRIIDKIDQYAKNISFYKSK